MSTLLGDDGTLLDSELCFNDVTALHMLLGVVAALRVHLVDVGVLPVRIHKIVELVITSMFVLELDHLIEHLHDDHLLSVSAGGIHLLHVLALHPLVVMEAHAV